MPLDPRTPVLIGSGQFLNRATGVHDSLEPAVLMAEAVRLAAADAGLAGVPQPDAWRVVSLLTFDYGNPGWVVAQQLGLDPAISEVTPVGGNSPQALVNRTALDIAAGTLDLAVLVGGEASRARRFAKGSGAELQWTKAPPDNVAALLGDDLEWMHPNETGRGVFLPVQVYPMFETAIRAAAGRTVDEQQVVASELWARFSEVAAHNPYAWLRTPVTAEEIRTTGPRNRMIGFPYTKLMNSNNQVDMGAAVIMCSAARAEALGVPRDRWVFPHSGTDCHEHAYISNRHSFAETPAVRIGGRLALDLAGVGIDDIELIDLYSCFPSAVQLGAQSLGLSLDRQLTLTGGLTFAGGPWNNYVMHAIATVMNRLRDADGGARGFVWANGGFLTKHGFGVYSNEPPADGFRWEYPQAQIDALPARELAVDPTADNPAGAATIEAYTVMHSREGEPEKVFAACLLPDGRRAWGTSPEVELASAMCVGEWVGRAVTLSPDGLLTPS